MFLTFRINFLKINFPKKKTLENNRPINIHHNSVLNSKVALTSTSDVSADIKPDKHSKDKNGLL